MEIPSLFFVLLCSSQNLYIVESPAYVALKQPNLVARNIYLAINIVNINSI